MIYKSEFAITLTELQYATSPSMLVKHATSRAAKEIGLKIVENIPFRVNEQKSILREGFSASSHYEAVSAREYYDTEIFAVSLKDWEEFKNKLKGFMHFKIDLDGTGSRLSEAITELESK